MSDQLNFPTKKAHKEVLDQYSIQELKETFVNKIKDEGVVIADEQLFDTFISKVLSTIGKNFFTNIPAVIAAKEISKNLNEETAVESVTNRFISFYPLLKP